MKMIKEMTIEDCNDRMLYYLITFVDEVDMNEIEKIARKVKDEVEFYTFDDLLESINILYPIEEIIYLENFERLSF